MFFSNAYTNMSDTLYTLLFNYGLVRRNIMEFLVGEDDCSDMHKLKLLSHEFNAGFDVLSNVGELNHLVPQKSFCGLHETHLDCQYGDFLLTGCMVCRHRIRAGKECKSVTPILLRFPSHCSSGYLFVALCSVQCLNKMANDLVSCFDVYSLPSIRWSSFVVPYVGGHGLLFDKDIFPSRMYITIPKLVEHFTNVRFLMGPLPPFDQCQPHLVYRGCTDVAPDSALLVSRPCEDCNQL